MGQAVIFDLDGVITDTARLHFLAWKQMANDEGMDIDEQFNETLKGVDRIGSLKRILAKHERQYEDGKIEALADRKNEYYKRMIAGMTASDLLPGAFATLERLRTTGIKIGLASASKNASAILERLGIHHLFDYVVDSGSIARGKPDPEIFLSAAKGLGAEPTECIGVEDAVVGVEAIKAAGMYAIGVGDCRVLAQADCVIADLTEFPIVKPASGTTLKDIRQ